MTHSYQITGMTCGSCVARVKSELLKLGNVISAEVQLNSPQAIVEMSQHIPTQQLQEAVKKAGGYTLVEFQDEHSQEMTPAEVSGNSYFPVFLIFGYITLITVAIQVVKGSFNWLQWSGHFMAGFFFVFSFFKILDLKGFSEGYGTYDVITKRFPAWGKIYPFVELGFAVLLLIEFQPFITNLAIFIIMGISSIGVIQSLRKKRRIQCACLGTVIKLPLGKVTLIEDLLMVVMSLGMVIAML
jgi:copper chaperone CopZ